MRHRAFVSSREGRNADVGNRVNNAIVARTTKQRGDALLFAGAGKHLRTGHRELDLDRRCFGSGYQFFGDPNDGRRWGGCGSASGLGGDPLPGPLAALDSASRCHRARAGGRLSNEAAARDTASGFARLSVHAKGSIYHGTTQGSTGTGRKLVKARPWVNQLTRRLLLSRKVMTKVQAVV